jgi:hypothetical protein
MPAAEREPVRRFEWPCPGDLLQMDTKRLAGSRAPGTRSPVCVTRPAPRSAPGSAMTSATRSSTITPGSPTPRSTPTRTPRPSPASSSARWRSTPVSGSVPDACRPNNAWAYVKNRSLRELLAGRDIQHRRIPPRTPKRNGKVERYQQTLAREWAYGQRYRNSNARAAALPIWLNHYNYNRNHSSLANCPPISRLVRNQPRHNN